MVNMTPEEFESLVDEALELVPDEFLDLIDNVVILVEDDAPDGDPDLLGLYDGVALTERGSDWAGDLPDRILIFRNPILAMCEDFDEVRDEVAITVVHEIAHLFGFTDEYLAQLGYG